jgi:hypothetical protein
MKKVKPIQINKIEDNEMVWACLDCSEIIQKGPYFQKRLLKHLQQVSHDHAAAEYLTFAEYKRWFSRIGRYRSFGIIMPALPNAKRPLSPGGSEE